MITEFTGFYKDFDSLFVFEAQLTSPLLLLMISVMTGQLVFWTLWRLYSGCKTSHIQPLQQTVRGAKPLLPSSYCLLTTFLPCQPQKCHRSVIIGFWLLTYSRSFDMRQPKKKFSHLYNHYIRSSCYIMGSCKLKSSL